ncbi:DNA ligase [Streptomyces sp. NPDC002463]|uniref:ATP-dependent DNA ligase n=1 Tax=Streptomyces sp. NPDC002463 TaxID=3364645 RepID=UPI0036CB55E9
MLPPPVDVMRPRAADEIPAQAVPPRELQYSLDPDGFRAPAFVLDGGKAALRSRSRRDLAPGFPGIAAHLREQLPPGLVLDGELYAHRDGRLGSTDLIRSHADRVRAGAPVSYVAFDLLAVPGRDVRALPLRDRRELPGAALREAEPPLQRVLAPSDEETARGCFRDLWDAGVEGASRSGSTPPTGRAPPGPGARSGTPTRATPCCSASSGRPNGPGPGRPAHRRPHPDHLAPADPGAVPPGRGARGRPRGVPHGVPGARPVRWVDPPLAVELRQVAGRHGTAAFVRVRSEG